MHSVELNSGARERFDSVVTVRRHTDRRAVTTAMSGVSAHDEPLAVGRDRRAAAVGDDGFGHVVELDGDDRLVACQQDGPSI
jgi:hypothetical protein